MKYILSLLLILNAAACGPYYPPDPNSNTIVTSQYEDQPVRIILPSDAGDKCKPQFDCKGKVGAECSAALYNNSQLFIDEGEELAAKKLYLSASVEYMQALCRLTEAEIRLKRSKTENFDDWHIAVVLGLEKKIKERIKVCERKIYLYQWKR